MSRLYLKPGFPGAVVRDEHTKRPLPEDGAWVNDTPYWRRRMACGDAALAESTAVPARSAPADKEESK